jgi:hypothetical protein
MTVAEVTQIICKSKGLVYGNATRGSYNSPMFKNDDPITKVKAICALLEACNSSVLPTELCSSDAKPKGYSCLPGTLQSAGNDDADLTFYGPDENGNCFYNLVITGKGIVGWSAQEDSCICIQTPF